jgi:hypothetical protein
VATKIFENRFDGDLGAVESALVGLGYPLVLLHGTQQLAGCLA